MLYPSKTLYESTYLRSVPTGNHMYVDQHLNIGIKLSYKVSTNTAFSYVMPNKLGEGGGGLGLSRAGRRPRAAQVSGIVGLAVLPFSFYYIRYLYVGFSP